MISRSIIRYVKYISNNNSYGNDGFSILMHVCEKFSICDAKSQIYLLEYIIHRIKQRSNRRYIRYTNQERKLVVSLYRSGYSIYKIAKTLNMPFSSVYYIIRNLYGMGPRDEKNVDHRLEDIYRKRHYDPLF